MLKFVVRRVLWTIPIILLVIFMTFLMMRAIKGSPFRKSERAVPPAVLANLNRNFGLDKPWYIQYLQYVEDVATFDLGPSLVLRNQTVNDIVKEHFPVSAELGGLAMLLAIVVGIPLGILAALRANTRHRLPADALREPRLRRSRSFLVATLSSTSSRRSGASSRRTAGTAGARRCCRSIALSLGPLTYFARIVRGQMLETLQQDYVRTAKAKGLRWKPRRQRARPAQLAHPRRDGGRPAARLPRHRLVHHREHLRDPGDRPVLRDVGLRPRLLGRDGDHGPARRSSIIVANLVVDILYGFLDPRTRDART